MINTNAFRMLALTRRYWLHEQKNLFCEAVWLEELLMLAAKHDVPRLNEEYLLSHDLTELYGALCALRSMDSRSND